PATADDRVAGGVDGERLGLVVADEELPGEGTGGRARHEQREKQPTVREAWRHLGIPSPSRREGSVGADLARLRTIGQVNSEPDGCRAGPRRGGRDLTRDSPQVPRTQPRPCEASVEMCDFCEDSVRSPVPSVALGGGTSMFDGLGTLA